MTTTKNFLFKESEYDFDNVLLEKGYVLDSEKEDFVSFSKDLKIVDENSTICETWNLNEYKKDFKMEMPMAIIIHRPKMLNSNGKYELCSPYYIMCNYYPKPMFAHRQMAWSVFPGTDKRILSKMVDIAEKEAMDFYKTCMKTDTELNSKTK
jgi:hypothetical protein